MEIKVYLDKGAKMPTKAHSSDAGFDLYMPMEGKETVITKDGSKIIDTGVHMMIPDGYVGMIKSKSGLNVMEGILCEGVVDAGYTGSIIVKAYSHEKSKVFHPGDKLTQIVILPIPDVELKLTEYLENNTERGNKGFGSSGR